MGLNYDGTYVGVSVVNNSAGNTWTSGGSQPCVTEPAPILVISRGRAQFPWQGYTLTGNVTPSGPPRLARFLRGQSIANIGSPAR
jgi:hypothetical protein